MYLHYLEGWVPWLDGAEEQGEVDFFHEQILRLVYEISYLTEHVVEIWVSFNEGQNNWFEIE